MLTDYAWDFWDSPEGRISIYILSPSAALVSPRTSPLSRHDLPIVSRSGYSSPCVFSEDYLGPLCSVLPSVLERKRSGDQEIRGIFLLTVGQEGGACHMDTLQGRNIHC